MRKFISVVTSMAVVSAVALPPLPPHEVVASPEKVKTKYAPRFDGLRFIETLVTGHR
ncbi:hypothetical protein ZOSMA_198G00110 [Zostera marina]|uniref:Uncharacterized protein n=1 Tax=Zostera marina TaxID=29655 RepID=A0A0K9PQY3_ZOSMR|nr:hypothetical protein ZOSMA_198G00110 [Zostera marina]